MGGICGSEGCRGDREVETCGVVSMRLYYQASQCCKNSLFLGVLEYIYLITNSAISLR